MWAMQPPQPYIPHQSNEEEVPFTGRAQRVRTPNGGQTHFNVFLNQPSQQQQSPPQQQYQQHNCPPPQPNMWVPPPVYVQAPPQVVCPQPMFQSYAPYGMPQQQPTVIFMGQPQQPGKTKEEEKEEEEAKRLAEQEKLEEEREREEEQRRALEHMQMQLQAAQQAAQRAKSEAAQRAQEAALARPDDMSDICIASIIIYCIGFILGICSVVRTNDAYDAHLDYEEESTYSSNIRQRSGSLYETWQMARNTALGTGASAVVCFSLAFLLVFWSGMQYKMKRKVVPGFCMTGLFISGWIVFALTFLIDVVVLVLAFDEDNVVYPEVVWAAFIGNVAAWLLMMTHSELARRR